MVKWFNWYSRLDKKINGKSKGVLKIPDDISEDAVQDVAKVQDESKMVKGGILNRIKHSSSKGLAEWFKMFKIKINILIYLL